MPDPVEAYFTELRDIHRSGAGVKETSYYAALSNLLNEIGRKLKPRVRCIINLQNAGAGLPDGGLFTSDQFPRSSKGEPRQGQPPARGAIEVKGADEDVRRVADTKQVQDYLKLYRQVLVTNYRDFLLMGHDHEGRPCSYESYSLAENQQAFWSAVAHPQTMAKEHGERLIEYLRRAMLRRVELVEPKDVAWFLASYAREAKARVEARKDLPELAAIRSALEDALGMKFEGEKGEHFFRSTLVQTLFYGVFSAWVLWDKHHKGDPAARFNWHEAGWYLHVPMISALFQQISSRAQLGPLDVAEVLDWAGETLNRVSRGQFFSTFEEGHAVQYFYEPFLQAFDPELRKELGVWYTPPEIVQYMVERVDRVLREELDIADGLADPNVYVLDPCCGTGAYLVAEKTGRGVICYISNSSYLGDPSFVVMRRRLLDEFDALWLDCLNGDSRETGKLTPDGHPDPSIFSTEQNREGIRLGTAVALMVRATGGDAQCAVRYRDLWGVNKRDDLLASLRVADFDSQYAAVRPTGETRFSFRSLALLADYSAWPKLVHLCAESPISGLAEMRKGALMSMDRDSLIDRMRAYYDPKVPWKALHGIAPGLVTDAGAFAAEAARDKVLKREQFSRDRITSYALYPFDSRWCYYTAVNPIWNRPRPALVRQRWDGNSFIITRMMAERPGERVPMFITSALPDYHLLRPNVVAIPIRVRSSSEGSDDSEQAPLIGGVRSVTANLSPAARAYLASLNITNPDADAGTAGLIWMHALAIGYSPVYLNENADGIRRDWPRVPLPDSKEALLASAELGKKIAALLDTETSVPGVTSGDIRQELREIAVISRDGGGALNLAGDLSVTAGWGHAGKGRVTMPGSGKLVKRAYSPEEAAAITMGTNPLGLSPEDARARLGESTRDVYLNDGAYWRNVPEKVWGYTIGGYQVMKKWLSYREADLLGRSLTMDEAREVTNMARRIAAILLLEPALDGNYQKIKANAFPWAEALPK